jgi:type I restriction enzyme S subunit
LISIPEIAILLDNNDAITNKVQPKTMSVDRFDPKYYSRKSLAIVEAIANRGGTPISELCESMTNGFESRDFQLSGTPYLTVSEISSGRVDISTAPRISASIDVPTKAKANRNCVLAVRGGSVGIAAKVFDWDESAAISSDLIRMEFASEDLAAAVAAFLGSKCGACLMKRASYGAVMPKLGQEELASILIPNSILRQGYALSELMRQAELCIRLSASLINSAKLLVEALIERKITEDELIYAQTRLEQGDDAADRAILSRLFEGGWDATETRPLFPDLDAYYETLRMVEREQTEAAAK